MINDIFNITSISSSPWTRSWVCLQYLMVSKMVVVTFVIAIIRIVILLLLSQFFPLFICHCQGHIVTFVTVFSPFHLSLSGSYCYICYSLFPFCHLQHSPWHAPSPSCCPGYPAQSSPSDQGGSSPVTWSRIIFKKDRLMQNDFCQGGSLPGTWSSCS